MSQVSNSKPQNPTNKTNEGKKKKEPNQTKNKPQNKTPQNQNTPIEINKVVNNSGFCLQSRKETLQR